MARYAEGTSVSSESSRGEIERILARYGADQFMYGWEDKQAVVAFRAKGRHVRFLLPLPSRDAREFRYTPSTNKIRTAESSQAAYEQAIRQRWRALALVIKAKLEAVAANITTFEDEFLAHTVLPDGSTVSDWMQPQVEKAYALGVMPVPLALPAPREGTRD